MGPSGGMAPRLTANNTHPSLKVPGAGTYTID